ncbi:hypothetical protein GCM10027261_14360 [Geodermatophilus arenarius]|uniref:WhiB family transcriptional regulator n=1 Tax=Geodermatophilus arenarius TaxID=1137990 RepID=A0ABV9LI85_9ACTN
MPARQAADRSGPASRWPVAWVGPSSAVPWPKVRPASPDAAAAHRVLRAALNRLTAKTPCQRGPAEDWFPVGQAGVPQGRETALRCQGCPVIDECLAAGLAAYEVGIWGGTSEGERDAMRRAARAERARHELAAARAARAAGAVADRVPEPVG